MNVLGSANNLLLLLPTVTILALLPAKPILAADKGPATNYENVVGDSGEEDQTLWDTYYRVKGKTNLQPPIDIVKQMASKFKPGGKILNPAMAEGRNTIYLAAKGFEVTGIDISEIAVHHATAEAKARHLHFRPVIADLTKYDVPKDAWDGIVLSQFHMHSLLPKWRDGLKRGGYLVYYVAVDRGKGTRTGMPTEFMVKKNELEEFFKNWKVILRDEKMVGDQIYLSLALQKP